MGTAEGRMKRVKGGGGKGEWRVNGRGGGGANMEEGEAGGQGDVKANGRVTVDRT